MPPTTTIHHHPPPVKIYPPPLTTSQNISTTTHRHPPPPTAIHHHPPPPTTSQNILTNMPHTTYQQPKCIQHHQHQSKKYPSKKLFYKENIKIFYSKMKNILINYLVTHYVIIFQDF